MKRIAQVLWLCGISLIIAGCGFVNYAYTIKYLPDATPPQQPLWNVEYSVGFSPGGIALSLKNGGTEPINIIWDECAYIDPIQGSHRVVTSQARMFTSNLAQPPTPVAPNSTINEVLIPADYISGSQYGTFVKPLFPANPGGEWLSGYSSPAKTLIGKEVGLLLVVERKGEKRRWVSRCKISDVKP